MSSTKTVKDLTIEDIQYLFDSVIFLRGEEYFEEGLVASIEAIDSFTINGTVRGNEEYTVSVSLDENGEIICDCSCPCDFNCKHAAALLLKWLSIKGKMSKELKQSISSSKQSLQQLLGSRTKDELIDLLKASIERHPELKSLVQIERKELITKIKRLFSQYWEWNEVKDLISQLEIILDGIQRNKSSWNKELYLEMETCSAIMIKNLENVHDEGDLGIYWEDWFLIFGEVFASTKPSKEQKDVFAKKILGWIKDDDYGNEGSYEKAFVGMCTKQEDLSFIQKISLELYEEEEDRKEFLLEIYEKLGLNDKYLQTAKETGNTLAIVDKFISLNKLEEALEVCKKNKASDISWLTIENRKLEIFKKLGRKEELKKGLASLIKKTGEFSFVPRLKAICSIAEWDKYCKDLITDAQGKKRNSFLSRLYYQENNFKKAYEHSNEMRDEMYLELLAKKLSTNHPELACTLFRKLCFYFIDTGSGWPYKKAGKMLEAIKKIDKNGSSFQRIKNEIIRKHKKKYSLMAIIERV